MERGGAVQHPRTRADAEPKAKSYSRAASRVGFFTKTRTKRFGASDEPTALITDAQLVIGITSWLAALQCWLNERSDLAAGEMAALTRSGSKWMQGAPLRRGSQHNAGRRPAGTGPIASIARRHAVSLLSEPENAPMMRPNPVTGGIDAQGALLRALLKELSRTGAPHVRSIYTAMLAGGIALLFVLQQTGRLGVEAEGGFVAQVENGTTRAVGPNSFHPKPIRRLAGQVESIAIIGSDIKPNVFEALAALARFGLSSPIVLISPIAGNA